MTKRLSIMKYFEIMGLQVFRADVEQIGYSERYMSDIKRDGSGDDLAVQEAKPRLKQPPQYKVILLNDDYTPMEFVVHILEVFFSMGREKATQIMMHVHTRGMGVCGVFTRDIAETKVEQVNQYSRENQHPLKCVMEEN